MRRAWGRAALAAALAVGAGLLAPAAAGAAVVCGQSITTSTVLTQDLTCSGTALFINAPGVVLNLGGHTITGPAPAGGNSFLRGVSTNQPNVTILNGTIRGFDWAIRIGAGASDVLVTRMTLDGNGLGIGSDLPTSGARITGNTIQNMAFFSAIQLGGNRHRVEGNTITSGATAAIIFSGNDNAFTANRIFDAGASAFATSTFGGSNPGPYARNSFVGNTVSGNSRVFTSSAFSIVNGSATLIDGNTLTGRRNAPGVFLNGSASTTVSRNSISNYNTGVLVRDGSSGTDINTNTVFANQFTGILVENGPTGTGVTKNVVHDNGANGIDASSPATTVTGNTAYNNAFLGIRAVAGVTDGGGNTAFGNGNSAQCSPTIAC